MWATGVSTTRPNTLKSGLLFLCFGLAVVQNTGETVPILSKPAAASRKTGKLPATVWHDEHEQLLWEPR